jgi:hypothetical protein
MNPYLQRMTVAQLQDLFIETTKEFVRALEIQAPFTQLKYLRDQIKSISEVLDNKRKTSNPRIGKGGLGSLSQSA